MKIESSWFGKKFGYVEEEVGSGANRSAWVLADTPRGRSGMQKLERLIDAIPSHRICTSGTQNSLDLV